MQKLHIEVLAPRTPQQTYLDERLRAARWLGWDAPRAAAAKPPAPPADTPLSAFVSPPQGEPA